MFVKFENVISLITLLQWKIDKSFTIKLETSVFFYISTNKLSVGPA